MLPTLPSASGTAEHHILLVCADGHEPVKYAYSSHGHKFDFLLKPLPRSEEEEAVR